MRYDCPANLTKDELRAVETGVPHDVHDARLPRRRARRPAHARPTARVYVIEVNPLPGLTPDYSDLCLIANGAKIDYRTLIGEILSGAIKRWQAKHEGVGQGPQPAREQDDKSGTLPPKLEDGNGEGTQPN